MYPEIAMHGIELSLSFDDGKNAWVVKMTKGGHTLTTFLDQKDADACLEGRQCVYLGIQITQFVNNFEEQEVLA
jgi:hypothetical protein